MLNESRIHQFVYCLQHIANLSHDALHTLANTHARNDNNNHAHDKHNEEALEGEGILLAKITAMLVLFLASSICGSLPFLIQRCFNWPQTHIDAHATTVVKCLLYFGGGVLLCTTFVHLLPEVQETVQQLVECQLLPKLKFPLAQLLMCLGFFFMYLVEETIHTYINHAQYQPEQQQQVAAAVGAFERGHSIRRSVLLNATENVNTRKKLEEQQRGDEERDVTVGTTNAGENTIKTISTRDLITYDAEQAKYEIPHCHQHNSHHNHHHSNQHQHNRSNQHFQQSADPDLNASLRGLFIVLALSIHELFEGMAIGLENSTSTVWVMFGAVSAHKLVLAFCVGVELIVARTRLLLSIIYIFTFAVVSPLGIGIGILVSNHATSSSNVASVFLQGLACGTLLYVVFFEILSKNYAGVKAIFALIVGFAIMFGLQLLGADEHEHSHESCAVATKSSTTVSTIITSNELEEQLQLLRQVSADLLKQQKNKF